MIVTAKDIKEEIIKRMTSIFPDTTFKYYGIEVTEGYECPSFFIDVRLTAADKQTINLTIKRYSVSIVYFQEAVNEADNMDVYEKVVSLLSIDTTNPRYGMTLKIIKGKASRVIRLSNIGFDYIGQNNNILSINFDTEFKDFEEFVDPEEVMGEADLKEILKEEY